jgi:hypothetical protein
MGLDPNSLPERVLSKLSKADRPAGVLTLSEASAKEIARTERDEQKTFAYYLSQVRARGKLRYYWAKTNKASTNMPGTLDFMVPISRGRTLYIEFKAPGGRLTKEQHEEIEGLKMLGHKVVIIQTAEAAIRFVKEELNRTLSQ